MNHWLKDVYRMDVLLVRKSSLNTHSYEGTSPSPASKVSKAPGRVEGWLYGYVAGEHIH